MMPTTPAITAAPIPGTYWQWRGYSVYYVQSSKRVPLTESLHPDRPPLLLIHGFGASTDHWRKNISGLSQDFEVWAIDLIGFGRSAKPEIQYSGDLWRDQLHDFITNVIGRPAVLAGNSLGGYAALCVAAQRPESAAGLILINSAGPFSEPQPAPEAPALQKAISAVAKALFQQDWASFLLFQYVRQRSTIRKTLEKVYLDQSAVTDQLVE
jgi:pimeloyl-ACP methyl ester carboxylesterase